MLEVLRACNVCARCPVRRAMSITTLCDKSFKVVSSRLGRELKNFSTVLTSQVHVYRGRDGLFSKTPFINLLTRGWVPNVEQS